MATADVEAVQVYKDLVDSLLKRSAQVKPEEQIEPPLSEALLGESIWQVSGTGADAVKHLNQQTQFAAVEIAFREKFYHILVRHSDLIASISGWLLIDCVRSRLLPRSTIPLSSISGISST